MEQSGVEDRLSEAEVAKLSDRFEISRRSVANAESGFILNAWYIAGLSSDFDRKLSTRTICGKSILFFRDADGGVHAMQNRCGHRSYPLSAGTLDGNEIVCGYHGLRYNAQGICVQLPDGGCPRGRFGVRSYPLVERASFVWIWVGDAELAKSTPVPHPEWLGGEGWSFVTGYSHAEGSYVHLHENLLDLSHLTYLHAATFGTPEFALAPIETEIKDDDIQVWRNVECQLPPIYSIPLGWEGQRALRRSGSQLVSPGLHVNTGIFENLELAEEPVPKPMVKVAQLITPETQHSIHYHYAVARNFALDDDAVGDHLLKGSQAAFREDIEALRRITQMHAEAGPGGEVFEFDIPTDRAGLEMRRRFKKLIDLEEAADA